MKDLVSVARTDADKAKEAASWKEASASDMDDYPYGLSIYMNNETIEKIGVPDLDAEQEVSIRAVGYVREDGVTIINGKKSRNLSIQITKMAVDQTAGQTDIAKTLYGDD